MAERERSTFKRNHPPSSPLSPTTATPMTPSGSDEDEEQETSKSSHKNFHETSDTLPSKRRKKAPAIALTYEQEEQLVEWLQQHPELYDKGHKKYKDIRLKTQLWTDAATGVGLKSGDLMVWYKSMRTRFGKLNKKAGAGFRRFSSRDQWILDHFQFFAPHIYVCPNRGPGLPKQKLVLQPLCVKPEPKPDSGSELDEEDDDDMFTIQAAASDAPPNTSGPATSTDSIFQQHFTGHNAQTTSQVTTPAVPSQSDKSMAHGYGYFLSTFVSSLHKSLLTQFYQESWEIVMRYHQESERLMEEERRRNQFREQ